VSIGQQADYQPLDQVSLTDNDFSYFAEQRAHKGPRLLNRLIHCAKSSIHSFWNITERWTRKPENAFNPPIFSTKSRAQPSEKSTFKCH